MNFSWKLPTILSKSTGNLHIVFPNFFHNSHQVFVKVFTKVSPISPKIIQNSSKISENFLKQFLPTSNILPEISTVIYFSFTRNFQKKSSNSFQHFFLEHCQNFTNLEFLHIILVKVFLHYFSKFLRCFEIFIKIPLDLNFFVKISRNFYKFWVLKFLSNFIAQYLLEILSYFPKLISILINLFKIVREIFYLNLWKFCEI